MRRATTRVSSGLTRRAALTGVGVTALGLSGSVCHAAAQDTDSEQAMHPIVGVWNVTTLGGPALAVFFADGANIQGVQATQMGPQGVEFVGPQVGTWEPTGPRSVHFTGVQWHSDAKRILVGSVTIDGYPEVSEDGQTFRDDQSQVVVTMRDPAGTIVQKIPGAGAPAVTGVRMAVGNPGFPEKGASAGATPAPS